MHGVQDYLPAPRLISLMATRTPATPITTAIAIGAIVSSTPSKDEDVTVDGHQDGAVLVDAKDAIARTPGRARAFFNMRLPLVCVLFLLSPCTTVYEMENYAYTTCGQHDHCS